MKLTDLWRVIRREVFAGLALGAILGTIGFLRIAIWSAFSTLYGPHWLLVAMTVSLSLIGIVLWGTLVGSILPFILRRLGFDPATSSAPFVATLVDVTGLIIYFSVGPRRAARHPALRVVNANYDDEIEYDSSSGCPLPHGLRSRPSCS